jgi:hypothetical protein
VSKRLPSWRPGPTREAVVEFLDHSLDVPVDSRVAYLDNDGTMWCEKPTYVQFDFFVDALRLRTTEDASLAERPEFAAVLSGDMAKIGELGLHRVAGAVVELFDGVTPEQFGHAVDEFLGRYRHRTLGVPVTGLVYQPILELLIELRAPRLLDRHRHRRWHRVRPSVQPKSVRRRAGHGRRHADRLPVRSR